MFKATESAVENLKEYLAQNNITSAIRVVMQSSCSGTSLGLGLDEKKDSDKVFVEDGITFLVDNGIFATTGAIKVDYIKSSGCGCGGGSSSGGFAVSSEKKLGRGGSCSTGSCSSGSCGC
jgi:Fe-S cluster assembly iron-binding protein IscA